MKTNLSINSLFLSLLLFNAMYAFTPEHAHGPSNWSNAWSAYHQNNAQQAPANPKQQTYGQLECNLEAITETLQRDSHIHIPGPEITDTTTRRTTKTTIESSSNWSGYACTGANNSVSMVAGSWAVPTIVKSSPANTTYCAFWVGIDGFSSSTVEQIGTAHDWSSGKMQSYAWFEMYPGGSYSINGFPLKIGDAISAEVLYSGNGVFTMTLYNDTEKVYTSIPTSYTTLKTAQRNSAEWIVEAPYYNGILPLSNFGTGHLSSCTATINGVTNTIGSFSNIALQMITNNGAYKAYTAALTSNNASFSVTWDHQ